MWSPHSGQMAHSSFSLLSLLFLVVNKNHPPGSVPGFWDSSVSCSAPQQLHTVIWIRFTGIWFPFGLLVLLLQRPQGFNFIDPP
jgi:hypothetical protein